MNENERMLSGKLYNPFQVEDSPWGRAKEILEKFNNLTGSGDGAVRMSLLKEIFAYIGKDAYIEPPFYCDHGTKITVGDNFYANTGLLILDEAKVTIGNHVFLAPRVCIYTATHPIDAVIRRSNLECAYEVTIGNDVWIGGNVIINPGVTIGSNVVIGSGAVVTKDIPDGVIAAGNPCKVIRKITKEDSDYWEKQAQEYYADI